MICVGFWVGSWGVKYVFLCLLCVLWWWDWVLIEDINVWVLFLEGIVWLLLLICKIRFEKVRIIVFLMDGDILCVFFENYIRGLED